MLINLWSQQKSQLPIWPDCSGSSKNVPSSSAVALPSSPMCSMLEAFALDKESSTTPFLSL